HVRVRLERLRKLDLSSNEHVALLWIEQGTVRIAQSIGIKKESFGADSKVVDGTKKWAVVEEACTKPQYCLSRVEWIESERKTWTEIVDVGQDAFLFVAQ